MKTKYRKLFFLFFFVFYAGQSASAKTIDVKINNSIFHLEVADTPMLKEKGLSNRQSLKDDGGMIFIYDNDEILEYCMFQCLIPLDLIYVDSAGKISDIFEMQTELYQTPRKLLKRYKSSIPVRYVIELKSKKVQQLRLHVGDTVEFL